MLFDGPPAHEAGRFVETEDGNGRSINAGEWLERDGYWVLRIEPVVAYVVNHIEGSHSGILTLGENAMLFDDLYEGDVSVKLFVRRDEAEAWLADQVTDEDDEDPDEDKDPDEEDEPCGEFRSLDGADVCVYCDLSEAAHGLIVPTLDMAGLAARLQDEGYLSVPDGAIDGLATIDEAFKADPDLLNAALGGSQAEVLDAPYEWAEAAVRNAEQYVRAAQEGEPSPMKVMEAEEQIQAARLAVEALPASPARHELVTRLIAATEASLMVLSPSTRKLLDTPHPFVIDDTDNKEG